MRAVRQWGAPSAIVCTPDFPPGRARWRAVSLAIQAGRVS